MVDGLIGKKVGMTQLFREDGSVVPVTVIEAGPCVVVQLKSAEPDGYDAVQLGLVDAMAAKRANKPQRGHHDKAGVPPTRLRREFRILGTGEEPAAGAAGAAGEKAAKLGDPVSVDIFDGVPRVDIAGTSKGKGFQGVIKRHGFGGGRATHGSMFHRAPGSIGQSAWPSKVLKGMRGPGQMGNKRISMKNLKVERVDAERNLLLVRGAVPGARGSVVTIRRSKGAAVGAKD